MKLDIIEVFINVSVQNFVKNFQQKIEFEILSDIDLTKHSDLKICEATIRYLRGEGYLYNVTERQYADKPHKIELELGWLKFHYRQDSEPHTLIQVAIEKEEFRELFAKTYIGISKGEIIV